MKILIFGGTGMLGHKLVQQLSYDNEVFFTARKDVAWLDGLGIIDRATAINNIDVTNDDDLNRALQLSDPDTVINAVGLIKHLIGTKNTLDALLVNSVFPQKLAGLCSARKDRLISVSTDCVFNGRRGNYSEKDISDAEDIHGKTKFLGEVTGPGCLTIRTSIVGRELTSANGLMEWFLGQRGRTVGGYTRAIFSGFPTVVLADIIADLVLRYPEINGLVHIASQPISKFDLLSRINAAFDCGVEITPDPDFEVDRSLDGSLFRSLTGFVPDDWDTLIEKMTADTTPYHLIKK